MYDALPAPNIYPPPSSPRLVGGRQNPNAPYRPSTSNDPRCPTYTALSYTWGNPITIYEDLLPDLAGLALEEHADLLLFAYCSPDLDIGDPNGGTKGNSND